MKVSRSLGLSFVIVFSLLITTDVRAYDQLTIAENYLNIEILFGIFSLPPINGACIGGCKQAGEIYDRLEKLTDSERQLLRRLGHDPDAPDAKQKLQEFRQLQDRHG